MAKSSSKIPGKFIIGLTGNIATGKSVVRKMLEHLGAYGIDADALANRAILKGAPGYQPVVDLFGKYILDENGEINRSRLGRVVFSDPEALRRLEQIVHPLVFQAIDVLIERSTHPVIAIEAIKLMESDLRNHVDSLWVATSPEKMQVERLMRKRRMSEADALQRIRAQSPQEQKVESADIVIKNDGSYEDTWKLVTAAWKAVSPTQDASQQIPLQPSYGGWVIQRGRPRDSQAIADLINRLSPASKKVSGDDIMEAFGEKAYLLVSRDSRLVCLAGWQVENLVVRTIDLLIDPQTEPADVLKPLVAEIESLAQDLQCEASLLFAPLKLADNPCWKELGYEQRTPETLGAQAWQDAAVESQPAHSVLFFKQLRIDRVLRPI